MKFNFKALNRNFRSVVTLLFIMVALGVGAILLQYFSSTEYARDLSAENITERINEMRDIYALNEATRGGSYFSTGSENPLLNFPLGIVATLFRPFPWEARNFNMFFSAVEAFVFLLLSLHVIFKLGLLTTFRQIFRNGETIFFLIFVIIFAAAVGTSTGNFGTLVRYKIPCLPFYLMLLFVIMHTSGVSYPRWLNMILGIKQKQGMTPPVRFLQKT
jgi:hypothetical protein